MEFSINVILWLSLAALVGMILMIFGVIKIGEIIALHGLRKEMRKIQRLLSGIFLK